jgi:hypothetical protein
MRACSLLQCEVSAVTNGGASAGDAIPNAGDAIPSADGAIPNADDAIPNADDAIPNADDAIHDGNPNDGASALQSLALWCRPAPQSLRPD